MTLTVHLFARVRELAGADTVSVELPAAATVADLRRAVADRFPQLAGLLERSAIAVNHEFAPSSQAIEPDIEVGVIPPVSGG